jgi:hypothetical protein
MRDDRFSTATDALRAVDEAITQTHVLANPGNGKATGGADAVQLALPAEWKAARLALARLWLALIAWLRSEALPWAKQCTEKVRGSLEELGSQTEARVRASWRATKPRIDGAKQQLARAVDDAKQKLRPSKAPPAAAGEHPGADGNAMGEAETLELSAHDGRKLPPDPPPAS